MLVGESFRLDGRGARRWRTAPDPDAIGGGSYPDRGKRPTSTAADISRSRPPPPTFFWDATPPGGMVFAARPGRPKVGDRRRMGLIRGEWSTMSTPAEVRLARRAMRHELEAIRGNWGWLLALGIVLIVVGTIAIGMPFVG